jgi:16S rRNA (adenine1518-N6/adenine1519-N6)-dimethyltransferase
MGVGIMPICTGDTIETGNQFSPKKSLGQHWLNDDNSLNQIISLANLSSTDLVVEIGPGTGSLTKLLVDKVAKVIAIELDESLSDYLRTLKLANLLVENIDVLKFNFEQLREYKVVANIPYYLTGKIIKEISQLNNRPELVVLLVQKEIADRLSAEPGNLSVLGLTAQYFWQVSRGPIITADKFEPPPKVDSQIIKLLPKELSLPPKQQEQLFRLIKIGFSSKRKTILNNLRHGYRVNKELISEILKNSNIDKDRRPQTLSLIEWQELSEAIIRQIGI